MKGKKEVAGCWLLVAGEEQVFTSNQQPVTSNPPLFDIWDFLQGYVPCSPT
jgi:hypothetical protein